MTDPAVSERTSHDIREDEEQGVKLQEILDILVAAGYFRARIKGLPSFDKVVGGMVWCMESCYYDVHVDLLFQENFTIGQKILLTEKIVSLLTRMGCPHRIEPHQIQGLDFIHIYPVIQWLVKQSVTKREERREFLRDSATMSYNHRFNPNDNSTGKDCMWKLEERYRPQRVLRRKDELPDDEDLLVSSTLMEYGWVQGQPSELEDEVAKEKQFVTAQEIEQVLPKRAFQAIVQSQGEAIAAVSAQFEDVRIDEDSKTSLANRKEELLAEKAKLEIEVEDLLKERHRLREATKGLREHTDDQQQHSNMYSKLEGLIQMEEMLRLQEQKFKDHCREELERFQKLVEEEVEKNQTENEDSEILCEAERARITNLRSQIARRNRAIAQLQRRLDEIPGRSELAQYQKRFIELYNLVSQKHAETKQFYTMYNTLDDTRVCMAKELNLLNSVLDTYSQAMASALDKPMFIQQFEGIVAAIKANKAKVEARRNDEMRKKDALSHQLQELIELQRRYVSVVRQMKMEMKRNENLLAQVRSVIA